METNFKNLPDGDLMLECDSYLTRDQMKSLHELMKKNLPDRKVLIFDRGVRLKSINDLAKDKDFIQAIAEALRKNED